MNAILGTATSALLMAAVLILIPMVPGGPIETRSFEHLARPVLWGFNLFLISVGIASMVVAVAVLGASTWTFVAAAVLGGCYVGVFGLDLAVGGMVIMVALQGIQR